MGPTESAKWLMPFQGTTRGNLLLGVGITKQKGAYVNIGMDV